MNKMIPGIGHQKGIRIELIILGAISFFMLLLPFVSYSYKKKVYTISGLESISGKLVMAGKVEVTPNLFLIALAIVFLLVILLGVFANRFNVGKTGKILLVIGIAEVIIQTIAIQQLKGQLEASKDISLTFGAIILVLIGIATIFYAMLLLKEARIMSALDFMVIPGLLYLLVNNYIPMAGVLIAFKKIDYSVGVLKSPWIGFENFKYLFTTNDAFIITRNTLGYNMIFIILGNVMGIVVAIALAEIFSRRLQKFFQTSILLPHMISMVIVAYIVYGFLGNQSGWINNAILADDATINFYQEKLYWPFILIFVNTWKMLGYSSIIYLASVVSIDKSLYEAAYVDGCGRLKQITKITLPLLKPTVITLFLIQAGRIFYSDFGLFYQVPMNSGILFSVTQTIDTYVYRSLLQSNNIAMASAAGAYQSVVGFIFVLVINTVIRKVDKENALF